MRLRLLAVGLLALMLGGASLATAEEVTRDTYKAQVEPICKTNREANEKLLKGVKKEVRKGEYAIAGKKFGKAAVALKKAYVQLKAVPQPAADQARLTKWLAYLKQEVSLFEAASKALKAENKSKIQSLQVKIDHTANLANSTVLSFSFHYCKVETSKFS